MFRNMPSDTVRVTEEMVHERLEKLGSSHLDLWFTDLTGALRHATMEKTEVDNNFIESGAAKLDGSSIPGFTEIYESDLVLKPDWNTLARIPWLSSTARVITDVYRGGGDGRLGSDPRAVAQRGEALLSEMGYSGSFWGPEPEFFVFDDATYSVQDGRAHYNLSSFEAPWTDTGRRYTILPKAGYYPSTPKDTLMEYRNRVSEILSSQFGIRIEAHHHEVATAGQCEIDFRFGGLVETADRLQTVKYVVKNVASQFEKVATFMPKPIFGDNGSGMHTHQSLWKSANGGTKPINCFYDSRDEYAELSQVGRYYVGGLLEHGRAISAVVSPTTNSYKRLVPGYEAPVYLAWSKRNRSAAVRVPGYYKGIEGAKRVEYRPPDPSCNPYLAFAAMLAAGLDGISKKIDPGDPVDENIYHLTPSRRREFGISELPGSLKEAVEELQSDSAFLKAMLGQQALEHYVELKIAEFKEESLRPTPSEFLRYFDA